MKKHYLWISAFVLLLATPLYAQETSIYLSNNSIKMDVIPEMKNNTMYVPISFISKELGANVKWVDAKVIITKDTDQIICIIGNQTAYKNDSRIELANPPYLSNNRTFVPLRSISELLDCTVDYEKQTNRINILPNHLKEADEIISPPTIALANDHSNFITLPVKWNNQDFNGISIYKAIWKDDAATTNIYRPQVNELFKFNFGKIEPDKVSVKMEYLTDNLEESDCPQEEVPVIKNGDYYEFTHQPIPDPSVVFGSRIYIIEATWGENICEYAFVVDNKWTLTAYEKLKERMKELNAMDYCVVGNWVYYVVMGDEEGFHKMLLDGTQDTRICDFSKVTHSINGSTSVTSEVKEGYVLYKFQGLRQYDANEKLEEPHPIDYYRLNLSDNSLERFDID